MTKLPLVIQNDPPSQKNVMWAKPSEDKYELFISTGGEWKPAGNKHVTAEQLNEVMGRCSTIEEALLERNDYIDSKLFDRSSRISVEIKHYNFYDDGSTPFAGGLPEGCFGRWPLDEVENNASLATGFKLPVKQDFIKIVCRDLKKDEYIRLYYYDKIYIPSEDKRLSYSGFRTNFRNTVNIGHVKKWVALPVILVPYMKEMSTVTFNSYSFKPLDRDVSEWTFFKAKYDGFTAPELDNARIYDYSETDVFYPTSRRYRYLYSALEKMLTYMGELESVDSRYSIFNDFYWYYTHFDKPHSPLYIDGLVPVSSLANYFSSRFSEKKYKIDPSILEGYTRSYPTIFYNKVPNKKKCIGGWSGREYCDIRLSIVKKVDGIEKIMDSTYLCLGGSLCNDNVLGSFQNWCANDMSSDIKNLYRNKFISDSITDGEVKWLHDDLDDLTYITPKTFYNMLEFMYEDNSYSEADKLRVHFSAYEKNPLKVLKRNKKV